MPTIPMNNKVLAKIAFGGGILCLGFAVSWMEKIQAKLRLSPPYQKGLKLFRGYDAGVELLGQPLKVKRLDLSAKGPNKVSDLSYELTIPLKGAESKGALYIWSSRSNADSDWLIERLDLKVEETGQKWTFYKNPDFADKHIPTDAITSSQQE